MTNRDYKSDINVDGQTYRYILEHKTEDIRKLALHPAKSVDMPFVLDQVQGWQTARKKLPTWAATDGIVYPPHLNMEQCSSEQTARYKANVVSVFDSKGNYNSNHKPQTSDLKSQNLLVDLTGGFGVDFAFMVPHFQHAVYVEHDERLCAIARHNFRVLGLDNVEVVNGDGVEYLHSLPVQNTFGIQQVQSSKFKVQRTIYLDPARRDVNGKRVYGIENCTPDVLALKDELLAKANTVMIKLSPMLDWHEAVSKFGDCVKEVHIVSVGNECKELLVVMSDRKSLHENIKLVCVNDGQIFCAVYVEDMPNAAIPLWEGDGSGSAPHYLYIPNASIMKAGVFSQLAAAFPVFMADDNSHLFLSNNDIQDFPGRRFFIDATTSLNKQQLRRKLNGLSHANIAVRNFPMSVVELRNRLRLKDGGNTYLFATTARGLHLIYICHPCQSANN